LIAAGTGSTTAASSRARSTRTGSTGSARRAATSAGRPLSHVPAAAAATNQRHDHRRPEQHPRRHERGYQPGAAPGQRAEPAWPRYKVPVSPESPVVRGAKPADVDALEALDRRAWDETSTPAGPASGAMFGSRLPLDDTLVAELDGRVVGFVTIGRRTSLESNRHVAALRVIAVAPEARRRMYEREGFAVEGRLKDEFELGGRFVDDVVMGRFLGATLPARD
jgi:hypothetical protein